MQIYHKICSVYKVIGKCAIVFLWTGGGGSNTNSYFSEFFYLLFFKLRNFKVLENCGLILIC